MSSLLTTEKKLLIMLIYTLSISFMVAGVFLFSIFNGDDFLYLTFKFIVVSLLPLFIFYKVDLYYTQRRHLETFVLSHLEWVTHHYIMYLILFLANNWLVSPILALMNTHFNFIFLVILGWIFLRYLKGFNLMLYGSNAPKSKINFTMSKIKAFTKSLFKFNK